MGKYRISREYNNTYKGIKTMRKENNKSEEAMTNHPLSTSTVRKYENENRM